MVAIDRNKSWSCTGEEASDDPKPPKKLVDVFFDSGRSCEIRFPVMGQTISKHRIMIVSRDKSEMFLTSDLAQAPFNLSNSAFSKKCDFLTLKFERQSITIDSCVISAIRWGSPGFE
jgi:hypothetical protein